MPFWPLCESEAILSKKFRPGHPGWKIIFPVTEISIRNNVISVTGAVRLLIRTYRHFYERRVARRDLGNRACPHEEALIRAGSHFDISISTSINISIRKIRKIRVNRGYISINVGISVSKRKWKKVPFLMIMLM